MNLDNYRKGGKANESLSKEVSPETSWQLQKKVEGNQVEYSRTMTLAGVSYQLFLTKKPDDSEGVWRLDFNAEGAPFITNKGLSVFREVVSAMKLMVAEVRRGEDVRELLIGASDAGVTIEDLKNFKKVISEYLRESPERLNGFSHESSFSSEGFSITSSYSIENSILTEEAVVSNDGVVGEPMKLERTLIEILEDNEYVWYLLSDNGFVKALESYVGTDFGVKIGSDDIMMARRMALYERILENNFPQYPISRIKNDEGTFIKVTLD